jgi:hypothetical protein
LLESLVKNKKDKIIMGFFLEPDIAKKAITGLLGEGIPRDAINILSSVPYPEGHFGTDTQKSFLSLYALAGGFFGAILGFLLAAGTALLYPLPTGGKAIVALPTVSIITYEIMMLSAILGTVIGLLIDSRLPSIKARAYDRRISEGQIGVLVGCETEKEVNLVKETLIRHGAEDTQRIDGVKW